MNALSLFRLLALVGIALSAFAEIPPSPSDGAAADLLARVNNAHLTKEQRREALRQLLVIRVPLNLKVEKIGDALAGITVISSKDADTTRALAGVFPFDDHDMTGHTLAVLKVRWENTWPPDVIFISFTGRVEPEEFRKFLNKDRSASENGATVAGCKLVTND